MFLAFVVLFAGIALSEPTHYAVVDNDTGSYFNNFSVTNSLTVRTNVSITGQNLTLSNTTNGKNPPYRLGGFAITEPIMPLIMSDWVNISFWYSAPENTTIRIQITDSDYSLMSESQLAGNTAGFLSSPINLSGLWPDQVAYCLNSAKPGAIRIILNMTSNNTNQTPTIDNLTVRWVVRKGDNNASAIANTSFPTQTIDQKLTRHSMSSGLTYPALRWSKNMGAQTLKFSRFVDDKIFVKADAAIFFTPEFALQSIIQKSNIALNKSTGTVFYSQSNMTYYSETSHVLTNDGTMYIADMWADLLYAYNTTDFSIKWMYSFQGGHGNDQVLIGDDGKLYTIRYGGSTFKVYAFNPNGIVNWTLSTTPTNQELVVNLASFGNNETLYLSTYVANSTDGSYMNQGKLYAINLSNHSISWQYDTGDITEPIVDENGIIYVGNIYQTGTNVSTFEKNLFAFYPNGSLKWNVSKGITPLGYFWWSSLRNDSVLITQRASQLIECSIYCKNTEVILDFVNTTDGSVLMTRNITVRPNNYVLLMTDYQNGLYATDFNISGSYGGYSYYDSHDNLKWSVKKYNYGNAVFFGSNMLLDENDNLYGYIFSQEPNSLGYPLFVGNGTIIALYPWNMTLTSLEMYHPGETIFFNVTTTMQGINVITGEKNKIQAYIDNTNKATLSYSYTKSNGDTVWTGTYVVPQDSSSGIHTYLLEGSSANIETDILTHFDSPANNTNNTGINITGTFNVIFEDGRACSVNSQCEGGLCVHNYCRSASIYCGDAFCDSGESCTESNYCMSDCGGCGSSSSDSSSAVVNNTVTPEVKNNTVDIQEKCNYECCSNEDCSSGNCVSHKCVVKETNTQNSDVLEFINSAELVVGRSGSSQAKDFIEQAKQAYANGRFDDAQNLAQQAIDLTNNKNNDYTYVLIVFVVLVALYLIFYNKPKKKKHVKKKNK